MLTKKVYKFELQQLDSGYRQENISPIEIISSGKLETQGETAFLEIQIQEADNLLPLHYAIIAVLGNEEEITLEEIDSPADHFISWEKNFTAEDYPNQGLYYLDQINGIKLIGTDAEGVPYLFFSSLNEPEIEFVLDDAEIDNFLEPETEKAEEETDFSDLKELKEPPVWELPQPLNKKNDVSLSQEPVIKITYN